MNIATWKYLKISGFHGFSKLSHHFWYGLTHFSEEMAAQAKLAQHLRRLKFQIKEQIYQEISDTFSYFDPPFSGVIWSCCWLSVYDFAKLIFTSFRPTLSEGLKATHPKKSQNPVEFPRKMTSSQWLTSSISANGLSSRHSPICQSLGRINSQIGRWKPTSKI